MLIQTSRNVGYERIEKWPCDICANRGPDDDLTGGWFCQECLKEPASEDGLPICYSRDYTVREES